jgi:hypothetical protein
MSYRTLYAPAHARICVFIFLYALMDIYILTNLHTQCVSDSQSHRKTVFLKAAPASSVMPLAKLLLLWMLTSRKFPTISTTLWRSSRCRFYIAQQAEMRIRYYATYASYYARKIAAVVSNSTCVVWWNCADLIYRWMRSDGHAHCSIYGIR